MNVYIPMATGQTIPDLVRDSVVDYDSFAFLYCFIVPCYADGVVTPNYRKVATPEQHKEKVKCECNSRNLAIEMAKTDGREYIAMQDRDIVHLYPFNYQRCVEFLDENLDYAGIALPWKDKSNAHVRIMAFVMRTEIFKQLQFRYDDRYHVCLTWQEDVLKFGKWGYLPSDKKLIKEI